jgi:tRNA-splicing ligase RtcB (3'-phosphate/5'-hydroxy nucleic acid ligase)
MDAGDAEFGVLCADHHPGYSQPIGGGIAYEGYVSPSGVGYDIGCGNKAVRTDLPAAEVDVPAAMREITRRISFGMGVPGQERADHPVLEKIRNADFAPQRKLARLAADQLAPSAPAPLREPLRGRGRARLPGSSRSRMGSTSRRGRARARWTRRRCSSRSARSSGRRTSAAMELAGEYAYAGRVRPVQGLGL